MNRPKHARRLSLFGLGTSPQLTPDELTPRPNTNSASLSFSLLQSKSAKRDDDNDASRKAQTDNPTQISRKLSKKRKPKPLPALPPPPPVATSITSFSSSSAQLAAPEREHDKSSSLSKKKSVQLRVALSAIFIPKPSRKKVAGILDGIEGISGGRVSNNERDGVEKSYCYISRSPSPPSPEIRPPSGLGQIASSVDLSTYAQEGCAASLSRSLSRTPSEALSISIPPSSNVTASTSPAHDPVRSMQSCESVGDLFYKIPLKARSAPSQTLIDVLNLSMHYCSFGSLSRLARTSRPFLNSAHDALYASIDSDGLNEDEKRRRRILETLATNSGVASRVKSLRWVCYNIPTSCSPSSISPKHSIPRRAPTVSLSSSPEEYILPRVLSLLPNLATLDLVQPYSSILPSFIPTRRPQRSPCASPVSTLLELQLPAPSLSSLTSLTLSGRTTLSTAFGAVLVRFLELHPGIRKLNLPDVFCLPVTHPSRNGSSPSSSSSSSSCSPIDGIPPVPPLPPSFTSAKDKEPTSAILQNLTHLTAPLTLASQLVPGRPLYTVDIELATSLFEGLHPVGVARFLAAAESSACKGEGAGRIWKAAREARRKGVSIAKGPTLRELRIRCTAKVDGRTIGRVLNAIGTELGTKLEILAIGWSGSEDELHAQVTPALERFKALQRLELFSMSRQASDEDDEKHETGIHAFPLSESIADLQAGIALERRLVEKWAHACPQLSYMEFMSERVWKAR